MNCRRCRQLELAVQANMAAKSADPLVRLSAFILGVVVVVLEPPTAGCRGCGVAVELPPERPHLVVLKGGRG